jgi:uncharacterized protein involved in response to NO
MFRRNQEQSSDDKTGAQLIEPTRMRRVYVEVSAMGQQTITEPRPRGGIPRLQRQFSIALLSYGFRPFFLGAGVWATLAMVLWIGLISGHWMFASAYGAVAWHAHEFLFGYVSAVLTGFLLTAIPNWTGRLPLQGRPLLALCLLWAAGRAAMLATDRIGLAAAAVVDCVYLPTLAAVIVREVIAGKNWRNLKVTILVALLALANVLFQVEVLVRGAPDYGLRLGIAAIIGLIVLVGGRITPSFTHNWLTRAGSAKLPAPLATFDMAAMAITALALVSWIAAPQWGGTAVLLIVAAVVQAGRVARWAGERTWREPMVFILHLGYAFVPLGALALGAAILWPAIMSPTGALHAWTAGAIGTMTLAVMTRATLGHTGRAIAAAPPTIAIYGAILFAALARVAAALLPGIYYPVLVAAAVAWIGAFGGFVAVYGPMLLRPRAEG